MYQKILHTINCDPSRESPHLRHPERIQPSAGSCVSKRSKPLHKLNGVGPFRPRMVSWNGENRSTHQCRPPQAPSGGLPSQRCNALVTLLAPNFGWCNSTSQFGSEGHDDDLSVLLRITLQNIDGSTGNRRRALPRTRLPYPSREPIHIAGSCATLAALIFARTTLRSCPRQHPSRRQYPSVLH